MNTIVLLAGLLSGCVYHVSPPEFAPDHPGNPEAQSAPLPSLSRSLAAYDPAAGADPEVPEMDHGAMGHGSMKGHGSMGDRSAMHHSEASDHAKRHAHRHWEAPKQAQARKNPVSADAQSLGRGKQLFQANCATCHGATGRGDGPAGKALDPRPADLTAMAGHHSDGDYAWKIANGRGAMPPWKGVLDDKQIWDVVNFVQSLGGKKSDAPHDHSKHKH